jgi:hypothetical protein
MSTRFTCVGLLLFDVFVFSDDYDEDDQDVVSQLQLCTLDMLHVWFEEAELVKVLFSKRDYQEALMEIVVQIIKNLGRPRKSS